MQDLGKYMSIGFLDPLGLFARASCPLIFPSLKLAALRFKRLEVPVVAVPKIELYQEPSGLRVFEFRLQAFRVYRA